MVVTSWDLVWLATLATIVLSTSYDACAFPVIPKKETLHGSIMVSFVTCNLFYSGVQSEKYLPGRLSKEYLHLILEKLNLVN